MRCDIFGASGHVTAKPFIGIWSIFYELSVYARKVNIAGEKQCVSNSQVYLPREVCSVLKDQLTMEQSIVTALQKSAEGIVGCTLAAEGLNKSRKVLVG